MRKENVSASLKHSATHVSEFRSDKFHFLVDGMENGRKPHSGSTELCIDTEISFEPLARTLNET